MSGSADVHNSFEALLERARSGDSAALAGLLEAVRPLIGDWALQQAHRMPPTLSRPSDIAQDTSLQAYTRFTSFRGSTEAEWLAWLKSIFRNTAAQSIRSARRKKRNAGALASLDDGAAALVRSEEPSPSEVTATRERWQQIMAHIFELPPDQKEAVVRVQLKGLPITEVAEQLGKTEAAVGGLLQRGLKRLRDRLNNTGPTSETLLSGPNREAAAALIVYLKREREGEIDIKAFVAEHPDCASELQEMIDMTRELRALDLTRVRT